MSVAPLVAASGQKQCLAQWSQTGREQAPQVVIPVMEPSHDTQTPLPKSPCVCETFGGPEGLLRSSIKRNSAARSTAVSTRFWAISDAMPSIIATVSESWRSPVSSCCCCCCSGGSCWPGHTHDHIHDNPLEISHVVVVGAGSGDVDRCSSVLFGSLGMLFWMDTNGTKKLCAFLELTQGKKTQRNCFLLDVLGRTETNKLKIGPPKNRAR